jgi:dodecin
LATEHFRKHTTALLFIARLAHSQSLGYRQSPINFQENRMTVAKIIEISSSSKKSFEDAISVGIARASETIADIQGAWVQEQKVVVAKGKVTEYRVQLKVTFVLQGKGKK